MKLQLDSFNGIAPKIAPHLLPIDAATVAQNCRWGSGSLNAWKTPLHTAGLAKVGTKKSLYLFHEQYWFHWLSDVDCHQGPVANDAFERTYFTGAGVPAYTYVGLAETGGGYYPDNWYTLGIPAPTIAPVLNVAGTKRDDPPDVTLYENRAYVWTYVSVTGEEGPPSNASAIVQVYPGEYVVVSSIPAPPSGSYNIDRVRIYRTNTGSTDTEYQYVTTLSTSASLYNDALTAEQLGEVLPSATWLSPPEDLAGLTPLPNGSFAGFSGKELCISVPYLPHAWPVEQRYPVGYDIVGLGVYGNNLLVLTTGLPYVCVVSDPATVVPERVESGFACVSKRGIVDAGDAIIYPSPEGLISVSMSGIVNMSEKSFTQDQWLSYSPDTFSAYYYEGHYLAFTATGGVVIDLKSGSVGTTDLIATGGYHHKKTGKLYLVVDGEVKEWNGGNSTMTRVWESKTHETPFPTNFGAVQIVGSGTGTLKLYADEVLKHTATFTGPNITLRLPGGYKAERWRFRIEGDAVINHVMLVNAIAELKS